VQYFTIIVISIYTNIFYDNLPSRMDSRIMDI